MIQARKLLLLLLCLAVGQVLVAQTTYTTIAGGDSGGSYTFDDPSNWLNGQAPPNPIPATATVEIRHQSYMLSSLSNWTNNGTIDVSNGGFFSVGNVLDNYGTINIADNHFAQSNQGTLNNKSGGIIQGWHFSLWNSATLNNEAGGMIEIDASLNKTSQGSNVITNAGTIIINEEFISRGQLTNSAGGLIEIKGSRLFYNSPFTNSGAIKLLNAARLSPGISGAYSGLAGSSIEWILSASGNAGIDYPTVEGDGGTAYGQTTFTVSLANGFEPSNGDAYAIFSGSPLPTNTVSLPALSGGKTWKDNSTISQLIFEVETPVVGPVTYTSIADGNWNVAGTWDANGIPPNPIPADATVEINHIIQEAFVGGIPKTNNGTININADALLLIYKDFDNFGTIDVKGEPNYSEFRIVQTTFNNKAGGILKISGGPEARITLWSSAVINNEADGLIEIGTDGELRLTYSSNSILNNAGTIDNGGYVLSYGSFNNTAGSKLYNNNARVNMVNAPMTIGGEVKLTGDSDISVQGNLTVLSGSSIEWVLTTQPSGFNYPYISQSSGTGTYGTVDLKVSLAPGFEPDGGAIYNLFLNTNPVPADAVSLPALTGGKTWKESRAPDYNGIRLEVEEEVSTEPGAALASNGNNQLVTVPDDASLDIECELSIEFWCKPTGYETWGAIVMKASGNSWGGGYGIYLYDSELRFFPTGFGNQHATGYAVPLDQWTHIAATYDGTESKVYVNGILESSKTIGLPIPTNNYPMGISGDPGDPRFNFNGHLDEVRVWNKALSQSEIQANMNCEIQTTSDCLVGNYHFNQGIGGADNSGVTTLIDASGNGNNGTLGSGYALTGASSNWVAPGGVTSGQACSGSIVCEPIVSAPPTCPGNMVVNNDSGVCGANVTFAVSSGDVATPASGSFFPVGTYTVEIAGTSGCGEAATCSFTVTVNDTEAPKFSNCPSNITVNNDTGDCGAEVSWTAPTFSDNCSGASASSTDDPGDFFAVGTTTVTYSGSDAANNAAADCSFTVTVNDTEKPSISCTSNTTVGTDAGECGADVTIPTPSASDNCSVVELKARYRSVDEDGDATSSWSSRVTDPSGYFPVGRYQIQWRAKDAAGKKRTCSYYLEVEDDEDPTAVCKNVTVDFNGQSDVNLSVSQVWNESASDDNCGTLHYVGTAPSLNISCEDVGNSFPLTVTIRDEAGNKDQCTATINVIGLACGWSEGANDGSLNCGSNTSATYDPVDESFDLSANGCWHDCLSPDKAAHVYQLLCGDGQLTARLASINSEGYAGLMARESLDPESRRAGVLKNNSTRRVRREYRASNGGVVTQRPSNRSRVEWLRIVRQGTKIKSYTSTNGSSWRLLYQVTFPGLADCIYVDMMAYSLNGSAEVEATFDQVSITGGGSSYIDNTTLPGSFTQLDTDIDLGQAELNIFPNPSNGVSQLELNGFVDAPAQIWVRDAFGKVVRQIELDAPQGMVLPLDLTGLPAGLYLITAMQDQQEVVTKKLVLQR